jgi:toxin YoeB
MRLLFTAQGQADLRYWATGDGVTRQRLDKLLDCTKQRPFAGLGDPVPLRHLLGDCWSRRIDGEHRLVYLVDGDDVVVLQARYHYESGS